MACTRLALHRTEQVDQHHRQYEDLTHTNKQRSRFGSLSFKFNNRNQIVAASLFARDRSVGPRRSDRALNVAGTSVAVPAGQRGRACRGLRGELDRPRDLWETRCELQDRIDKRWQPGSWTKPVVWHTPSNVHSGSYSMSSIIDHLSLLAAWRSSSTASAHSSFSDTLRVALRLVAKELQRGGTSATGRDAELARIESSTRSMDWVGWRRTKIYS